MLEGGVLYKNNKCCNYASNVVFIQHLLFLYNKALYRFRTFILGADFARLYYINFARLYYINFARLFRTFILYRFRTFISHVYII